ncbi:MAG: bifunctional folylpolyglutamate synthase/dihydrofolate synthase [Lachnospiraceae bacterium]|nr:bifunctional folylpolyglutamate synthase/dihydrofolate synthase [Lachnospiraceae bacterium]
MNYQEAVTFHEKTKQYGSILGLDSIKNLMHELNDIWKELKIVHIAGTNGKGSVCCFLSSVLQEAGYCVGQFNSPAVFDFREVYRINGEMINEKEYAECMEEVEKACQYLTEKGLTHPTVFEVETALAFLWFYQKKCDIVLLETGMGGSTDATNLIEQPLCSVLTSVSMDHMEFLGDSLEEIAKVKAGIIKENRPLITTKQKEVVENVFRQTAEEKHAKYFQSPEIATYKIENEQLIYEHPMIGEVQLSMCGSYQVQNSALAVEVLQVLRGMGYKFEDKAILNGLKKAVWQGRFECIHKNPFFVIDGAHNTDAAEQLKKSLLENFPDKRKIGIMGVMADKPYKEMLNVLLPMFDKIYTVTPDNPRSLSAEKLAEVVYRRGTEAFAAATVQEAVALAWKEIEMDEKNMLVVFGSLYYLEEVKAALKGCV